MCENNERNSNNNGVVDTIIGFGSLALMGFVGYKVGVKITKLTFCRNLALCYYVDPALGDHMEETLKKMECS